MDGFILTSVIGLHPFGGFRIENSLEGELGETRFYITRGCRSIAGEDVSPVTLTINEQIFLTELNERIADRGITMRVVLHGLTDDVSNLVILAVIDRLHGMQNTPLYRLEPILHRRHGTLEYHIRGIIQEPILVHACQMILYCIIETLARHASVILSY